MMAQSPGHWYWQMVHRPLYFQLVGVDEIGSVSNKIALIFQELDQSDIASPNAPWLYHESHEKHQIVNIIVTSNSGCDSDEDFKRVNTAEFLRNLNDRW